MSEYDKFFGKAVDVEIEGVKFQMKPMTVEDIGLLSKLEKEETRQGAIKQVLMKTLIPEINENTVKKISLKYFPKLLEKIMEINGLDKPENVTEPPKA